MEIALRNSVLFYFIGFSLVVSIRVKCLVGNDVILEQSFEILLAVLAEKEPVDSWA